MSKKFILLIMIMVIVIAIVGIFALSSENNTTNNNLNSNTVQNGANGTYQIRVNSTGNWILYIFTGAGRTENIFNGTGQNTIDIGRFNHLPNYAVTRIGNNTENITIEVLLNGNVVQTRTLTVENNYLEVINYQHINYQQTPRNQTIEHLRNGQQDRLRIHHN